MNDAVLAWVDVETPTRLRWRDGDQLWHTGDYSEFNTILAGRECVLLVDGNAAALFGIELPVSDLRTARQAAPFAIEERVAQPIEDMRLALAAQGDGRFVVAATAQTVIDTIAASLVASQLAPRLVTPEFCSVPCAVNTWTISIEDECAIIRVDTTTALKTRLADLNVLIPLLRREYTATTQVIVHASASPSGFPEQLLHGLDLQWRPPLQDEDRLRELAQSTAPLVLIDASSTTAAQARGRQLWRATAAVAVCLVVIYPLLLGWQQVRLSQIEAHLDQRNEALFRAAFPDIRRVVNPRVQADQALAGLRARAQRAPPFLELLAHVDSVRAQGFPSGTRVVQASYAAGALELGIEATGMDVVETVRSALKDGGLQAETLSAEAAEGKVLARVRVQAGS